MQSEIRIVVPPYLCELAAVSAQRIHGRGEARLGPARETVKTSRPVLRAERLNKVYWRGEAVYAVDNIDLEIRAGEYVAVMGPSGCGKTTLLSLLAGLDRPTSGDIILDGQSLTRLSENELCAVRRRKIGVVHQSFSLLPGLTALANVALPARLSGVPDSVAAHLAADLLSRVGLAGRSAHRPTQLSGGEQQRVAIARALVNEPEILMADEPTANLDAEATRGLRSLLAALNRERGLTILVVTHDRSLANDAHRLITLRDGRIVSEAPGGAAS